MGGVDHPPVPKRTTLSPFFYWPVGVQVPLALSVTAPSATQEDAPPLTAGFVNAPASRDRENPFTIEINFSEKPRGAGGRLLGMRNVTLREILRGADPGGTLSATDDDFGEHDLVCRRLELKLGDGFAALGTGSPRFRSSRSGIRRATVATASAGG